MAKKVLVPTVEEILEYREALREKKIAFEYTIEANAKLREMTLRLLKEVKTEDVAARTWQFCKNLTKCSHAPVSTADYKKMQKYLEDTELIDVVLAAMQDYYPTDENSILSGFDIIGYYYCVALLSQSVYRREECLEYLGGLTDYVAEQCSGHVSVLLRNMQRLEKEYSDLKPMKKRLEEL